MWWKIDPNNLPVGEVLAANFAIGTYGYKEKCLGYLHEKNRGNITCECEAYVLENCTHYCDLKIHDL
jgi:hypothetical protein